MSLKDDLPMLVEHANMNKSYLRHNMNLFEIYEGKLLPFVEEDLRKMIPHSFETIKERIAPINVLKKIVDKLARIYQENPQRMVIDGTDQDMELLEWYDLNFMTDKNMNVSNEFFNMHKASLVQPYVHLGKPRLRTIPNHNFLVYSNDPVNPLRMTHLVVVVKEDATAGITKKKMHVWTDEEFFIVVSDGKKTEIQHREMMENNNPDGINPYGKIPYAYINGSANLLQPLVDTDTFKMTKLIPVLLSDLNYAVMFQAFSIMFGIDVDSENLNMAPNAFWAFKSDASTDKAPQIGSIKPQVDIDQVLGLIQAELAFWMNTRGLKPGAVGQVGAENFSSGVSKMIDEMDTSEMRQRQAQIYREAEFNLWELVFKHMHPVWVQGNMIENNAMFTESAHVITNFPPQLPIISRGQLVADLKNEVDSGFISKRQAIKKLNPQLNDEEVSELLEEIEEEQGLRIDLNGLATSEN